MASRHLSERQAFGHWLAGFTAGEGCFHLYYCNDQPRGYFGIRLRGDDRTILEEIHNYLGIGGVYDSLPHPGTRHVMSIYQVGGVNQLADVILPHFTQFPLRNRKAGDFCYWRRGIRLHSLVSGRSCAGYGRLSKWTPTELDEYRRLGRRISKARTYRGLPPAPAVTDQPAGFEHWLAGFIAAEGCLRLSLYQIEDGRYRPQCYLQIRLRADDTPILHSIRHFFGGGKITYRDEDASNPRACLRIRNLGTTRLSVIPFLETYPLRAKKAAEVPVWLAAARLCLAVTDRPVVVIRVGHGNIKGHERRWLPADLEQFHTLQDQLRQLRQYRLK